MQKLLETLAEQMPEVVFMAGRTFHWSPKTQTITYRDSPKTTQYDEWALLHEAGHASLKHSMYHSDLELLLLEVAAWKKAISLAHDLDIIIDDAHVQDCLDTYRDWLHQRSTCPACSTTCLQISQDQYRCHNCNSEWRVTTSRFCRAYRRRQLTVSGRKSSVTIAASTFV